MLLWALGNIATSCPHFRDEVLSSDFLEWMFKNINGLPTKIKRTAVWAVSNLCRGKPSPSWDKASQILKLLTKLITETEDGEILKYSLWGMSFLIADPSENGVKKNNLCDCGTKKKNIKKKKNQIFHKLLDLYANPNSKPHLYLPF